MAGGTDMLGVLKDRILAEDPETLVNIKSIGEMDYMQEDADGLKIGAVTRLKSIVESPMVNGKYSILADSALAVATPQIRNMGTIGGNLCQDVRCWYYRYPHSMGGRLICRRKGKGPCYALTGDNRYNAILGGKKCYAVCPSDMAVALTAMDARLRITGKKGERTVPVHEFYTTMGNVLETDEILTEIRVPLPAENVRQTFLKFRLRESVDFAIVSVAAVINMSNGVCRDARIVLGAVAPTPCRAEKAEEVIIGKSIESESAEAAAEAALEDARPLSGNAYKVQITKALVKKAILS
jgi:xanthine dehydrogenase YagS FAD-binding subunit